MPLSPWSLSFSQSPFTACYGSAELIGIDSSILKLLSLGWVGQWRMGELLGSDATSHWLWESPARPCVGAAPLSCWRLSPLTCRDSCSSASCALSVEGLFPSCPLLLRPGFLPAFLSMLLSVAVRFYLRPLQPQLPFHRLFYTGTCYPLIRKRSRITLFWNVGWA